MYKILKINGRNKIFFSDLHLFHKKIFIYEKEARDKIFSQLGLDIIKYDFIEKKDYNISLNLLFFKKYKNYINNIIDKNNIEEVYNLGDFIFNNKEKVVELLIKNFGKNFYKFGQQNEQNYIILGNHDFDKNRIKMIQEETSFFTGEKNFISIFNNSGENINNNNIKEKFFYFIPEYQKKNIYILTHHPIIKDKNNYYSGFWEKLNSYLTNIIGKINENINIINIHGHTHSNSVNEKDKIDKITYINVSIDNLINKC